MNFCDSHQHDRKPSYSDMVAVHLHECLGRSRGQFEDHNRSQRTHHTDRWKCQELLNIKTLLLTTTGENCRFVMNFPAVKKTTTF